MKSAFPRLLSVLVIMIVLSSKVVAQDSLQQIIPGRENGANQLDKPYLILISIDGFRYDLADKYNAKFLLKMRSAGVQATSMKPGYPSLTFPNHYSIITGLYPAHHGLVDNYFHDPIKKANYKVGNSPAVNDSSWYGGEPLWVLAERQKLLTASYYWVGSEAAIDGVRPTYYYKYSESVPIDQRIDAVQQWLELPPKRRPHLITFYFPEVDHMEHLYGVDSKQTAAAVAFVDSSIQALYTACQKTNLPINYMVVSDHGFANLDTSKIIYPPKLDSNQYRVTGGSALVHIYASNPNDRNGLNRLYKTLKQTALHYKVYKVNKTPRSWHYRKKDDRYGRIGDLLLVPAPPYSFNFGGRKLLGAHGFDNRLSQMQATFYGWGPAFKQHLEIGRFPNVAIYPLVAHMMGLKIEQPIDGKLKTLKNILRNPK
ncbi:MAG TPA: ectonucleotide pyrophosphatase/phosphodiesterase [Arachidicoccus sp.]|nr:ectonucleotide pyrophosphatase/phosphodiesterase [Arachidicoccus sp.]